MIAVSQLDYAYHGHAVLRDVSLTLEPGTFTAIIGPNGAGKSTLLKLITGSLSLQSGEVRIDGQPLAGHDHKTLARTMAYVAQSFESAFDFTAYEIVAMGRFPYQTAFGGDSQRDREIIREKMEATGVWSFRERRLTELSGGERQRLILSSALAQEPRILLLDEPTTALDIKHQMQFYTILEDLCRDQQMTILTVTHDLNLASRFVERLVVMKDGQIAADGNPAAVLTSDTLLTVYEVEAEVIPHPQDGKPYVLI